MRGQWGEVPDFYGDSAANEPFTEQPQPIEQTVEESVRDAEPTSLEQFVDAGDVPAVVEPPTISDATTTATVGQTITIPNQREGSRRDPDQGPRPRRSSSRGTGFESTDSGQTLAATRRLRVARPSGRGRRLLRLVPASWYVPPSCPPEIACEARGRVSD